MSLLYLKHEDNEYCVYGYDSNYGIDDSFFGFISMSQGYYWFEPSSECPLIPCKGMRELSDLLHRLNKGKDIRDEII